MSLVPNIALAILSVNSLLVLFLAAPFHIKHRRTLVDLIMHLEDSPDSTGKLIASWGKSIYTSLNMFITFFLVDAGFTTVYGGGPDYHETLRAHGNMYLYAFTMFSFFILVALEFMVLRMGMHFYIVN
jgi:hypothetical protein